MEKRPHKSFRLVPLGCSHIRVSHRKTSLLGFKQRATPFQHQKRKVQTAQQLIFKIGAGSGLKGTYIMTKLLRSNSSKRLGMNGSAEIKNHPWFSDLDW